MHVLVVFGLEGLSP